MTSVRSLGVAVPEQLAKDQRVEDCCILSALCGETTMAINVLGVLIWCGLGHCSPNSPSDREIAFCPASFIRHMLD